MTVGTVGAMKFENTVLNVDCMNVLPKMEDNSVDFTLTDIPYNAVHKESNGLRLLDKQNADSLTFDLGLFLDEVYRVTKSSICIFCGKEQFSGIFSYFENKKGTTRAVVWQKSNPNPMNGMYAYLSGVEFGVWYKKRGGKFNAHCKNTVFKFPNGTSKLHPTEKNKDLILELIQDNTDEGDLVFDPCAGSGRHLLEAKKSNRKYFGIEIHKPYFNLIQERLNGE